MDRMWAQRTRRCLTLIAVRTVLICGALVLGCAGSVRGGDDAQSEQSTILVGDTGVLRGSLENGVSYVILPRESVVGGGVSVRVRIRAGTLDERDNERGAAHLVSRLVFSESANFQDGEARQRFANMGMAFDRLDSVSTLHSDTVYAFDLPRKHNDALDLALRVGADAVGGAVFKQRVVEKERRLIIEDARLYAAESRGARAEMFERLVPGSGLGERSRYADPRALETVSAEALHDYYSRMFSGDRTTVVVVGEIDGNETARAIARAFGGLRSSRGKHDRVRWRVGEASPKRAMARTIPGEPEMSVEVLVVDSPPGAVLTRRDFKDGVIRDLAIQAMRVCLRRGVLDGSFGAREVAANAWEFPGVARITGVSAVTDAAGWRESVLRLNSELRRVRDSGFQAIDLRGARATVVAQARREARSEKSITNSQTASWIMRRVRSGSTVLSRQQEYELVSQIAALVTDDEIGKVFSEIFTPGACTTVVVGPPGTMPSESDILGAVGDADSCVLVSVDDAAAGVPMIEPLGDGERGEVRSIEYNPATGITTGVFANGVVVHHKKMGSATNRVAVGVTLVGGRNEETRETRGYTSAAAAIWNAPAWCETSVAAVDAVLAGRDIELDGEALNDSMQISARCDSAELLAALGVISSTVREPLIEDEALRRWRESVVAAAQRRRVSPGWMLNGVFVDAIRRAGDPRYGELNGADAARVDLEGAQRWAEEFMDRAPLEIAIVGDIERRDALEAVALTLGALPDRAPVRAKNPLDADQAGVVAGSIEVHTTCDPVADHSVVLVGYRGVRYSDRESFHLLGVLRHLWQARLTQALQEDAQVASWVGTGIAPGVVHDDTGMIWAGATVQSGQIEAAGQRMIEILKEIHRDGFDEVELEDARQQTLRGIELQYDDPMHWALLACDLRYRGLDIAEEIQGSETVRGCDAWRIKGLLDDMREPDARVVITIRPGEETQSR